MRRTTQYMGTAIITVVVLLLLAIICFNLDGLWFNVHVFLIFGLICVALIGLHLFDNQDRKTPIPFLLLLATCAIDGFYLLSIQRDWLIWAYILLSIVGLYHVAVNAEIYVNKPELKSSAQNN